MNWLDAAEAEPYNLTEGNPTNITKVEPNPEVTYKNLLGQDWIEVLKPSQIASI